MRGSLTLAALFLATSTFAVPINYGDFAGTTVTFLQVTENTTSAGDPDDLFGAPTVTGDSIDFDPQQFIAGTSNAGFDTTASLLTFDIQATRTNFIDNVSLTEAGTTALLGVTGATATTTVTADVVVRIRDIDGAPVVGPPLSISAPMVFAPAGTFDVANTNGGAWSGIAFVDIDQYLVDNNIPFNLGATLVTVELANTLTASSSNGAETTITKQDADGVVITVNIPEPATALLAALAAAGFAARRR